MKPTSLIAALVIMTFSGTVLGEPTVVINHEPKLPPQVIDLETQWTVGGEDGDIIFGMMIDSLEDQQGNIYMLDAQLGQVEVFAPDGEHLRTISGQGEGPGEVRNPQNLVFLPDSSLGILELFPARFVTLSLDGVPGDGLAVGGASSPQTGFCAAFQATCRGGSLVVAAQRSIPSETGQSRVQYLARLSDTGQELTRFREQSVDLDFTQFKFVEKDLLPSFLLASAVDPQGRVYTVRSREEYAIEVYDPDGTLAMVIGRDFANLKRDEDDFRRLNALVDAWVSGVPVEVVRDLEPYEPAITEIHIDEEGVLWVLHSRSGEDQPAGVFLTYDTFSPEGEWIQEVSFRADADPIYDGICFLDKDRALLVRGYVLARWASRGAQNADFGEDESVAAMEISMCRLEDAR